MMVALVHHQMQNLPLYWKTLRTFQTFESIYYKSIVQ